MGLVTAVDFERQTISFLLPETGEGRELSYDDLVICCGSITRLPPIPGLKEHGYEMKSLADALSLRDHAIRLLEAADATRQEQLKHALLQVVVVGSNFTGIEVAGEFSIFLRRAAREFPNLKPDDITITVVEEGPRILLALDEDLAQYAHDQLRARGVKIYLNNSIAEIGHDYAVLTTGERLATHSVIWCAGIAPHPFITAMSLPKDEKGYLLTQNDLRVPHFENVWAIGDCAVNRNEDGTVQPPTAQHAIQQGEHAAINLMRRLRGEATLPCNIRSKGSLAALGCRTGVAKVFGVKLSGFPAWFLWRTVYLMRMPGLGRKLRVALDWTIGLFFKQDLVQLASPRRRIPVLPS
jgi:NADH dehydrogenase